MTPGAGRAGQGGGVRGFGQARSHQEGARKLAEERLRTAAAPGLVCGMRDRPARFSRTLGGGWTSRVAVGLGIDELLLHWHVVPVEVGSLRRTGRSPMSSDPPAWQPVDPNAGRLPAPLDATLSSCGSVAGLVALLVSPEIDGRWGVEASLLVARGWARKGRSVLLADASLDDPSLHKVVTGPNDEGVSDVILYGASVGRVARPIGDGLLAAPAGTPVADAAEVLAHPRWEGVVRGFRKAGALLLLHLPAGTPGGADLLARAGGIIVISKATTDVRKVPCVDRVLAVLGPAGTARRESREALTPTGEVRPPADASAGPERAEEVTGKKSEAADSRTRPELRLAVEPLSEPGAEDVRHASGGTEAASSTQGRAESAAGFSPEVSGRADSAESGRRGSRARKLVVALLSALMLAAGGVAAAEYLGFINVPRIGIFERLPMMPGRPTGPGPEATSPEARPTGSSDRMPETPVITHVLSADGWGDLETGLSTVRELRQRLPGLLFFLTVRGVDGADQFVLLAGPAYTQMGAEGLRELLARTLDGLDPSTWMVQEARYSFLLGEYSEAPEAQDRVQSLAALSIPAHVLQVDYPDGATGLRVYGGAFTDESQAAAMERLLRANGLGDADFLERRGRIPE